MENVSFSTDKILSDLTKLLDSGKITYEQFSEKYDSIVNTAKDIYAKNEETKQLEIREKSKVEAGRNELGKQFSSLLNNMKPQQPNWSQSDWRIPRDQIQQKDN